MLCEHLLYQFRLSFTKFPTTKSGRRLDASSGLPGLPVYFRSHIHSQMSDKYVFLLCFLHNMLYLVSSLKCCVRNRRFSSSCKTQTPVSFCGIPKHRAAGYHFLPLPLYFPFSDASALFPSFISVSCRLSRSVSPLSPGTSSRTLPRYCPQKQPETQGIWRSFFSVTYFVIFSSIAYTP